MSRYTEVDEATIRGLYGDDKALIGDLVQLFGQQVEEYAAWCAAAPQPAMDELADRAHKLKGSVAALGMLKLQEETRQLVQQAKAGDRPAECRARAKALLPRLRQALADLQHYHDNQ